MNSRRSRRRTPATTAKRRRVARIVAALAIGTLLATVAIVADGFDVKQTPLNAASIWAIQSGDGNRYARINADLIELDTVKTVPAPSELVQTDSTVLLYAQNNEKVVDVSLSAPADLGDEAADYDSTPAGTRTVVSSGSYVGYLTAAGTVFAGDVSSSEPPRQVSPATNEKATAGSALPGYRSDAIALAPDGVLYSYSSQSQSVLRYSLSDHKIMDEQVVVDGPTDPGSQLSAVGTTWALLGATGDRLWLAGLGDAIETKLSNLAVVQRPSKDADDVLVADQTGLIAFALGDGARSELVGNAQDVLGTPAAPTPFNGERYAAWLPVSGSGGVLFRESVGEAPLSYDGVLPTAEAVPTFRSNGSLMILNDIQSGWVWTVPDGALVTGSQDWTLADTDDPERQDDVEDVSEVVEPKPPVAVADSFGVRRDQLVPLPVLLNDHDPNDDVLSVVPSSVTGLDSAFGTVTVTDQNQALAVQVAAGASGSATFSYAVTDGSRTGGLNSAAATVTLTVHEENENAAPVWCGVEGCLQDWPTPEVQPGGTVTAALLPGWVDPDGDPVFVESALNTGGIGSVSATPAGALVYKHQGAAEESSQAVAIAVRVSDTRGAATEKVLSIQVTDTPQLTVKPIALVAAVNERLTVNPDEYVSGAAGSYRIKSATTPVSADEPTISVTANGAAFDFIAASRGNFTVSLTIADDVSEVVSLVRVSVVSADDQMLTTAPVTVFVRPKADTTVDVFTAVSNPQAHVLLLGEAMPETTLGASLTVDVVGQNMLRMRGSTADEQPGKLGIVRYTVSDGTDNPLHRVRGEATVYLLEAASAQTPLALNDSVTVRVGAQVDIPVLANDVAPGGNVVKLNAESVQNRDEQGLAFAAGGTLRYLAPDRPGSYELFYSVYTAGAPELIDSAVVAVEVIANGDNTAPRPHTLLGRVLSGKTVEIAFESFGADADGDTVVLDRVLTQPARGTASINATGDAIVYTSPLDYHGAIEFEYRVRDGAGATGEALVRVGVLDQRSNPSPITFSDYVEVQAGDDNRVAVFAAANDVEPGGGRLLLGAVTPDAPANTAEFFALQERIASVTDDRVIITAGTEPGLLTFVYSVTNTNGDIAQGLIVVKVVRASVPDYPVVTDTSVTLDERESFSRGIDVVTDMVSWNSGDVSELTLTLWGSPAGLGVSGWKISGVSTDDGLLAPFTLTGPNFRGEVVTTYGFLRIPAKNAIIVALNTTNATQTVQEDAAVTFDVASLVTLPRESTLQLQRAGIRSSGERALATCTPGAGTSVTYTAGSNAPWTDSCTIPARIDGQEDYTLLVVSIVIRPLNPQPELRSAALTQSPGSDPMRYDLGHMVDWQGKGAVPALTYNVDYSSDQFTVTQSGAIVTISVADNAVAGRQAAVTVNLSSHQQALPAVLNLTVGPAPSELPMGGTIATTCSQAAGSSCVVTVVGAPGEVNLYPNTPLVLVAVTAPSTCSGVSFAVLNARSVRATWLGDSVGGVCQATFVVQDAQGKLSAGSRNGSITVDLQGYPAAPNAVSQVAYGDRSVTLLVSPGAANAAYPALLGFNLYRNGAVVARCDSSGGCGVLRTETNGDKTVYEARAVNSIGESRRTVQVTAWSYATPSLGSITAEPVSGDATSTTAGVVSVTIANTDTVTNRYNVNGTDVSVPTPGTGTTKLRITLPVGAQTVTVTPLSSEDQPAGRGPATRSATQRVLVAGAPLLSVGPLTATNTAITVTRSAPNQNYSERAEHIVYLASTTPNPECTLTPEGFTAATAITSLKPTINGLTKHTNYFVYVCYSNGYGVSVAPAGSTTTWQKPDAPGASSYTYDMAAAVDGRYLINSPKSAQPVPADFTADFDNFSATSGSAVFGADPGIRVRYCTLNDDTLCSDWSKVTAADSSRAWQVTYAVNGLSTAGCVAGQKVMVGVTATPAGQALALVSGAEYNVPDKNNDSAWMYRAGNTVADDATQIRNVTWTISWTAPETSGLPAVSGTTQTTAIGCSAATTTPRPTERATT